MQRSPLSRRDGVICWKMDSAASPSASRRMTGGREHTVKMEGLGLEEPTKREFGVMGIGFLLMPGTLFLIESSVEY